MLRLLPKEIRHKGFVECVFVPLGKISKHKMEIFYVFFAPKCELYIQKLSTDPFTGAKL